MATENNPFYSAYPTSLSNLDERDWNIVSNRWSRGIDWNVGKIGRKWQMVGENFSAFPHYKTKTAAYNAMSDLILAETRWRGHQRWEQQNCAA